MKSTERKNPIGLQADAKSRQALVLIGPARWLIAASVALALAVSSTLAKPPIEDSARKKSVRAEKAVRAGADVAGEEAPAIPPADVKGPKSVIKADETTHDFGSVWVGPPLKHAFKITNNGDAPLDISKVKPACGCTLAGDHPKKLEPGQSGEFPFSMQSTKLRGTFEKGITISSNDPVTPELRLKLRGEVKRYVEVVPAAANFGKITSQEVQERIVNVTNNMDTPLQLTLKPAGESKFKFDLVEKTPGKQFDLHVTTSPPFEEGTFKTSLTLLTNVEAQKEIQVEVNAAVPARLEVQPTVVTLTRAKADSPTAAEPVSRVIKFTNYGKNPTKVLEATCDDAAVTATVTERKPGEAYTIQVQMPAGYQPPPEGRTLTIKTDDAQKPVITVPIQGAPAPGPTVTERKQVRPADAMVGQPAPSFNLATVEGKPVNNETLKDKVTVLDFFAPNCGFCKKQMPRLEAIREKFADKGVRFVAVSQKMGNKEFTQMEVEDIIKGANFKPELVIDHGNTVGPLFKANSYPTMIVVGKTGKVEAVNSGNLGDLESRLTGQIEALLAGKPVPVIEAVAAQAPTDAPKPARPEDLVGKPAPAFSLNTVAGKPLANADFTAAPATVLNFFAPNCGYCKKQIPRLETVRKTYVEKGVRFVNVAETMGKEFTEEDTAKILKDLGAELELARDPQNKVGPLFNATGFPTMVVIGKSGKVEAVNVGNVGDLESRLQGQLNALIAGKPVPAAAGQSAAAPTDTPKPKLTTEEMIANKQIIKAPDQPAAPTPGQPAAPTPGQPDDLVGKPAPDFSLTTLGGKALSKAEFANAPATVLNFFAPNCGYCKKQIPQVETIRKTYAEKGVRFVNVVETMGKEFSEEETLKILKDIGAELEVARDPGNKVGAMFNASGYPTMLVVGKSGKVEAANVGALPDLDKRLTGQLDALIAGKPVPAEIAKAPAAPARARPDDMVGKPAPAFALTTVGGKPLNNAELANAPATILNFFAPNCGYCKKQIPQLETIRKTYAEKGVRFVNVVETMGKEFPEEETLKILKDLGAELEVARDSGNKVGGMFNATGFPTMVVVGKSGKVEAVNVGALADLEKRVTGQLDALIAGKPIPAELAKGPAAPSRARPEDMVGKAAPAFSLTTVGGKPLSNGELANAPATVLNFFAPNCGYCKKQIPRLETIRKTYTDKGVRFVNVVESMGKEFSEEETLAILKELGAELEVARDPGNKVGPLFNATGYPTMVVVGKSGKVEAVNVGNIGDLESRLQGQLDALIAGKPVPAVAAAQAPPAPTPAPGAAPGATPPPQPPQRPAMQLVGQPAPAFAIDTLEGKKVSSEMFKDHPATVLNFVAPNCGYCKKQLPGVESVRSEYEAKGVRFVNVAQKMGQKEFTTEEVVDVFKGAGSRLELAKDTENKVGQMFKAVSYPTMVIVGRDGKIAHVNIGAQQDLDKSLKTQLDALIAGKPAAGAPGGN